MTYVGAEAGKNTSAVIIQNDAMIVSVLSLLVNFFFFLFSIFLAFYIPGIILIRRLEISQLQKSIISLGFGMVLWGWQGFLFGYVGMRWLSYIYLLSFFFFWLKIYYKKINSKIFLNFKIKKIDPIFFLIITTGVLVQTSILWLMGIPTSKGLYFCCGAIGDFIYHLGLTDQIISRFPPFEQHMFGVEVTNYHYWGNLVVAELVRVFHLPLVYTQFQYMGILLSLLLGLSAISFSQLHKLPKSFTRWFLFFLYFGGDFIFLVILITRKTFDFSMGPLENGAAFLNNPPRAFAVVLFFIGLSLVTLWIKNKDTYTAILVSIILGSLIGFKVYLGIFALTGLTFVSLYFLFKKKFIFLIPLFFTFLFSLIIYIPVNKNSGGIHFLGFWRAEEFIVQPALGLSHLELARQIFVQHNNWPHALLYDLFFAILFVFSIFGSKLFGIFQTKKSLSQIPIEMHIFLLSGIFVSFIAGLFFWQQSGGSNSFNFLVSVYIIGSIYSALAVSYWTKRIKNGFFYIVIFLIISLNLPRIMYEEYKNVRYVVSNWGYGITSEEIEAMKFLKESTSKDAVVLTKFANYQTFIGKRNIYLGDYRLLGSHDVDTSERQKIQKTILESSDAQIVKKLLNKNNISYIYIPVAFTLKVKNQDSFLRPIFKNSEIQILHVY